MTRVRKHTCGAGALLGVLLLAAFAGTALTLHYEARGLARGEALDRAAGRDLRRLVPGRPPGEPGARGGFRNNPRGRAHYCPDAGAIARARHGAAGIARCAGPERHVRLRRYRRRHNARRSNGFRRPRTFPGRGCRARCGDSRGCACRRPRRSGIGWQWRPDGAASAGDRGGARPFARAGRTLCNRRSRASISGAGALPARAARPGVSEPAGNRSRHEFRRPGQSCGPKYRCGRRGDSACGCTERRCRNRRQCRGG